jgi:uncharacterized protein (TIRG00374 family)
MIELAQRVRLWRGAGYFAVFTAAGLGILFVLAARAETWVAFRNLHATFLGLTIAAVVADSVIGALRYHIFVRRMKPDARLLLSIRADLAGRFIGAITPSQSGGGPAQVFVFFRGGLSIAESLSFLAINFLATMAFFLLAGALAVNAVGGEVAAGAVTLLIRYGFTLVAALGAFVLLALLRPDLIERACRAMLHRLGDPVGGPVKAVRKAGIWIVDSVGRYRSACLAFIRESPILIVWSFVLTIALYVNEFTLAYLILRGLGVDAPYLDVLAVQALLQFVLYVAPTPGGSGIGELSTAALMASFMEPHLVGVFTLVFRFFQLYLPAAAGFFVLLDTLEPSAKMGGFTGPAVSLPGSERALRGGAA